MNDFLCFVTNTFITLEGGSVVVTIASLFYRQRALKMFTTGQQVQRNIIINHVVQQKIISFSKI